MSVLRILVLGLLSCLLVAAPAAAFQLMSTSTGKELHWPAIEMPIPFFIESLPSEVTDGSDVEAIEASFEEWERPQCSYIAFERVFDAQETGGQACGGRRNTLAWMEQGWPPELGTSVLAITMTCFEPGGGILGSRVLFNGQDHTWATDGRADAIDVRNVATHEVGHFIGIGHSSVHGSTMWPTTSAGDVSQRELHRNDVEAVCFLYPTSQPWSPGNGFDVFGGGQRTADRLGLDRMAGCEGGGASGLAGATAWVVLLGALLVRRRLRRRRAPGHTPPGGPSTGL
jgi:hypothetical protein